MIRRWHDVVVLRARESRAHVMGSAGGISNEALRIRRPNVDAGCDHSILAKITHGQSILPTR